MTDELIHSEPCMNGAKPIDGCVRNARFYNGGNGSHWPYEVIGL
jgi:hypothetical protein